MGPVLPTHHYHFYKNGRKCLYYQLWEALKFDNYITNEVDGDVYMDTEANLTSYAILSTHGLVMWLLVTTDQPFANTMQIFAFGV